MRVGRHEYPDDLFADTRMTFGEHIEELRYYLLRALYGLLIALVIGFILDGIGTATGLPVGLGKPALAYIKEPIETQVNEFYARRLQRLADRLEAERAGAAESPNPGEDPASAFDITGTLRAEIDSASLRPYLREGVEVPERIPVTLKVHSAEVYKVAREAELKTGMNKQLTTLSAQEAFVVYFKVSLLCGLVLSCPWVFWQIWAFVAAGLYPHEKRYVYKFLPFSIGLFLGGVVMCYVVVMPRAVAALLAFNEGLGIDPDIRLNEWLGFAIILPLVFGVSFQTPLFMLFFHRLGIFPVEDYKKKWRMAFMIMAVLAALLTPTPDAITMAMLFTPMFGLYILGIYLCGWSSPPEEDEYPEDDEDIAV